MATQVIMPQLGESVVEGTLNRWLKNEGDIIEEFEPLLEIASDKVDSEIPSPASGTILKIYVQEGETVNAGTVLAVIGEPSEDVPDTPEPHLTHAHGSEPIKAASDHEQVAPVPMSSPPPKRAADSIRPAVRLSPVVARIAAEHNVDVSQIPGTGRGGRVTKKDILAYIEQHTTPTSEDLPPWEQPGTGDLFKPTDDLYKPQPETPPRPAPQPAPTDHTHQAPPSPGRPGEVVPLSRMRRLIADHMVHSKLHTAPHVTTVFEADMSAVLAHRAANLEAYRQRGINLTMTAYFVMAIARTLRKFPMVNSRWTDEGVYLYPDVNVGVAVAIDEGLIVPVIRRADELNLPGLARQINDLASRARSGKLQPDEIQGGTFTLTNHGVSGSLFATPIINQPQTGILGVGVIKKRVVVVGDDAIAIHPMVYITLTFDHRVLDGAAADFFVAEIVDILESRILN